MLLCEEVNVTSSSSWLIYRAVTSDSCSVEALRLCCHTLAGQAPSRTCKRAQGVLCPSLRPAGDPTGSIGPGVSPADGFPEERDMLRWTCGTRPLPALSTTAREALAPRSALRHPLALLWEASRVQLRGSPSPSFPRENAEQHPVQREPLVQ